MGGFLHSLCVRTVDVAGIRARAVDWLSAKGYELCNERPLFPLSGRLLERASMDSGWGVADERGLFLLWNPQWTVALYSHMDAEGDGLISALGRDPAPVLELWVAGNALWRYKLRREGKLLARFNSSLRSPGGRPTRVCEVCDLAGLETDVAYLQHHSRAKFAENYCRRFCAVIGAAPAGYDYLDLADQGLDATLPRTIAGFQAEHLYFVRRGPVPEPPPDLHRLPIESNHRRAARFAPEVPVRSVSPPVWFRILGILLWPYVCALAMCFVALGWPFGLWLQFLNRQEPHSRGRRSHHDPFSEALSKSLLVRREGRNLINERHRCRITVPEGVDLHVPTANEVFGFQHCGLEVSCEAVRPEAIEKRLRVSPGSTPEGDDNSFVGPFPARRLVLSVGGVPQKYVQVVQTPKVFYYFELCDRRKNSTDAAAMLGEIVNSFKLLNAECSEGQVGQM